MKYDYVIVGCGVIGLSLGIQALKSKPDLKIIILEKELSVGIHASGRNSGVLHAGFYYSPDTLKAKFCKDGNFELKKIIRSNGLPLNECGKVVVTKNLQELNQLTNLFERGLLNGVDLELLGENRLNFVEPKATTVESFIWSPTTAVSDPVELIKALAKKFLHLGGKLEFNAKAMLVEKGKEIFVKTDSGFTYHGEKIINSAGVYSDILAKQVNVGNELVCLPFRGNYISNLKFNHESKTLIYPVPHPINPFLGIHTTIKISGEIKIGPTALPVLGREQYNNFKLVPCEEIKSSVNAIKSLISGKKYDFWEILRHEVPKQFSSSLLKSAKKISNFNYPNNNWVKSKPGIRAQIVNLQTGELEQDYIVLNKYNSVHILNTVSPGWTSAIPFANWVISQCKV